MDEIDVPPFFLCPISLQIMRDPVTLSTGITFDRDSIEKWLFSGKKHRTCPVTNQPVSDPALTPNHTLRRLIQSWCTLNASHGAERIPTPKPPVAKSDVAKLLADASSSPHHQLNCLRRLKSISSENAANKRCIEAAGAVDFLAAIVDSDDDKDWFEQFDYSPRPSDEALLILHNLHLSESGLKSLLSRKNGDFVDALTKVIQTRSYESRAYAVFLLKSMLEIADPIQLLALKTNLFVELIQLLKDQISKQASKASLQVLINALQRGRNRVKAVESGAVTVLIELLLESSEKRSCELMLTAMDMLCQCAEGRAELVGHASGLAVVSKKILRVSWAANERAVRILFWVSKYSASPAVLQEMLQIGAVAKLCFVVQVECCGSRIKERAREVLKLHARVWKNSPCVPSNLLNSYPA